MAPRSLTRSTWTSWVDFMASISRGSCETLESGRGWLRFFCAVRAARLCCCAAVQENSRTGQGLSAFFFFFSQRLASLYSLRQLPERLKERNMKLLSVVAFHAVVPIRHQSPDRPRPQAKEWTIRSRIMPCDNANNTKAEIFAGQTCAGYYARL